MNAIPVLSSNRLTLRPVQRDDQAFIFNGLSHPEVIRYYGVSYDTFEATSDQMDWYEQLHQNGTGAWWLVLEASTNRFLGAGGLNDLAEDHRKAEIGFWLLPEAWGNGYMKEAFPLILNYAFHHRNLHRIEGFVDQGNANCKRALSKVGFTYEGTMRDCEVKDGLPLSIDIYSRLSTDSSS